MIDFVKIIIIAPKGHKHSVYPILASIITGAHNMKERRTLYYVQDYPLVHEPLEKFITYE